ncbi:MAG: hypothetical protein U0559_16360 [Anaerolineae bacterium]
MISIGTAALNGLMLIGSLARLTRRFGHRGVFADHGGVVWRVSVAAGLAENSVLFFAASIIGGAITGVMGGAQVNRLMERIPYDDLPAHMALNNMAGTSRCCSARCWGRCWPMHSACAEGILLGAGLRVLAGVALVLWA